MARQTFAAVAALVFIATLSFQASADEVAVAEKTAPTQLLAPGAPSVGQTLKDALYGFASDPANQPAIAGSFLLFGVACLLDGARSFQLLSVVCVGVCVGVLALTQLDAAHMGRHCVAYIGAAEIGVFVAAAAWLGWDGFQLLIGLAAGVYLYHLGTGLIALMRDDTIVTRANQEADTMHQPPNVFILGGYTFSIVVATFFLNDKLGAQRAFAIVAPVIGAAMVASTLEYMGLFYGTTPQGGQSVAISELPSVFDIMYMIVFPFHSRSVTSRLTRDNFTAFHRRVEVDKVIGVTLWVVLSLFGICGQCRQIAKNRCAAKEGEGDNLTTRLLDEPANPTNV